MRKDFALCFNDSYSSYAAVTIKSIADTLLKDDDAHVHVISDGISPRNRRTLSQVFNNVHFYQVDNDDVFKGVPTSVWSIYTWYRILIPDLLNDIDKVLYLDCDVLVNKSLDELFLLDMQGVSVAGCLDLCAYNPGVFERLEYDMDKQYICAGVLMMNLKRWREKNLAKAILNYAEKNVARLSFPDQDAINYICQDDKIVLPSKYGVLPPFFINERFIKEHKQEMEILILDPAIIHYAGYAPWSYPIDKSLHSALWWQAYKSLGLYPLVRYNYILSFVKTIMRICLSYVHVLKPGDKFYYFDKYYAHRRLNVHTVKKIIEKK